ncbi:hypothetical protein F5Y15DRAFT_390077 [Xylariaceae sp. FL0016]|nr:hypothetical protein F5Y15DRAFT_390077 [Xylariaceae sp. FL0016]
MEMDHSDDSQPGSPGAAPLQPISPDRANHQRENPMFASIRSNSQRDSDVHDKIRQFNNLSHLGPGGISMSKQLERKTADAALKRAMLGREEAESEMRRYREEARVLRRQIDDGRERERKVGERLETVMEQYGRAKEHHQHTQTLWEKEIRRARKDTFKSQSAHVKLQEELKAARAAVKPIQECLDREKERSKSREQEAFTARYQLVGLQEELEKAKERIKFVEEERDAFKAAAKSEEVARIVAEGRLPLPPEDPDSEFASPRKTRESLSTVDIQSSAASEAEIDELTRLWQWERQRADRTQEHLEFVQAECKLRCCTYAKSRPRRSTVASTSTRKERPPPITIVDPSDLMILGKKAQSREPSPVPKQESEQSQEMNMDERPSTGTPTKRAAEEEEHEDEPARKEPRRSTIFVPSEGIFRTISQQEAEALDKPEESPLEPPTPAEPQPNPPYYSRTPSVDPPTFALTASERRTSLLSLLNAPRESESHCAAISMPTTPAGDPPMRTRSAQDDSDVAAEAEPQQPASPARPEPEVDDRPHTSATFYTVTTTTSVPLREDDPKKAPFVTIGRTPSFDRTNPALTPTMTREQALAQIKERRGRARSAMQGATTPRRQMVQGVGENRNVSAPAGRTARGRT